MAEDLQIRIPVTLGMENIPEEVKKIQQQLSNNKNNAILIDARLSDNVISNTQNQLKTITQQQYNVNIGVGNTTIQSQLSQVQKQVVSDVDIIKKETDVLINEMIAKMQSLGTVDLSTFISNLKNNLGIGTKEVKENCY